MHLADGTRAGSNLSLDEALRILMQFTGSTFGEALPTITSTPAELLGVSSQIGSITPGLFADLVLLSQDLDVKATIIRGASVYTQ